MIKVYALVLSVAAASAAAGAAAAPAPIAAPPRGLMVRADWQEPQLLPPRFRNHCSFESFSGRPYCSDHCGGNYLFYYCSVASFGCCPLGRGYCDFDGHLRCHP